MGILSGNGVYLGDLGWQVWVVSCVWRNRVSYGDITTIHSSTSPDPSSEIVRKQGMGFEDRFRVVVLMID